MKLTSIIFLLGVLCNAVHSHAQDAIAKKENVTLSTLIDSAISRSPELKIQQAMVKERYEAIKLAKKDILKSVSLQSTYSYGNNNALINNQLLGLPYSSDIASTMYNGGVNLNISLFSITARKHMVNSAKYQYLQEKNKIAQITNQIRTEITELYVSYEMKKKTLSNRQEALTIAKLNYQYVEASFKENQVKVQEYAEILQLFVKTQVAYNQSFIEYTSVSSKLEVRTGIKMN